ncbi:ABC transporter substrate-binding protein [Microbacterium horticulturae]|uniref:ABC transporter substrate-binding protein n=1 Tax=Microbacterium horticulturae TaxID=3028316 RepID=A0ABY8C084_9MICO|nr:ABC transporter substrate-binding protein [Microbacterium sp. KACC 23027]WEG08476.1 ABC transporter substrate-binding protein [Microbacterium sp. KACC 23027]
MTPSADSRLAAVADYLETDLVGEADPHLEPVVLGWVTAGDGPFAEHDVDATMAAAVRLLNERFGGIGGHPVVVRRCLVDGTDAQSESAAAQLAGDAEVCLVLQGNLPEGAEALHRMLGDQLAVAVVSPIGAQDTAARNAYCMTTGTAGAEFAFGHYLAEVLGFREVGVSRVAFDRVSDPIEADLRSSLEARGGVARVGYFGALDRSPKGWYEQAGVERALVDCQAASADALVVLGVPHPDPVIHTARALKALGIETPVYAIGFGLTEKVRAELGDFPRWTYMSPDPMMGAPDPSGHVDAYRAALAEYLPGRPPESLFLTSMAAFGSVITLARVLAPVVAAEGIDRRRAEEALAGFRGPVFLGPDTTPRRDDPDHPAVGSRAVRWYRYEGQDRWELAADWIDPVRPRPRPRP